MFLLLRISEAGVLTRFLPPSTQLLLAQHLLRSDAKMIALLIMNILTHTAVSKWLISFIDMTGTFSTIYLLIAMVASTIVPLELCPRWLALQQICRWRLARRILWIVSFAAVGYGIINLRNTDPEKLFPMQNNERDLNPEILAVSILLISSWLLLVSPLLVLEILDRQVTAILEAFGAEEFQIDENNDGGENAGNPINHSLDINNLRFLHGLCEKDAEGLDVDDEMPLKSHGADCDSCVPPPIRIRSEDDLSCQVCQEQYKMGDLVEMLPCGHHFHTECIVRWWHTAFTCASCTRNLVWQMVMEDEFNKH